MSRPQKIELTLLQQLERISLAGLNHQTKKEHVSDVSELDTISERIKSILKIIKSTPKKHADMNYIIMYDITDNKVRKLISKFLEKQGCIRIQKSVFLAHTSLPKFNDIHKTLKEVNSFYDNLDSIILIPVNVSDVRSMKMIGQNVQIENFVDPPNTMFF